MTDTITFDMEPVRVILRELAKEQAAKKDAPKWKHVEKRDPNPFTAYWFFAWYKRRAKQVTGIEPRLKGNNTQTFEAYIAPFFGLGADEKPTKEQWTELYHVFSMLFANWRKFCDKHVKGEKPGYPPLGWLEGWWD